MAKFPEKGKTISNLALEVTDPLKAAEIMDGATDPFVRLTAVAKEAGMPIASISALVKRLRTRYQAPMQQAKAIKGDVLINELQQKLSMTLGYLDDYALSQSNAQSLATIAGILIDKIQLLSGEPTHILSTTERKNMDELAPAIIAELNRRGQSVEMVPTIEGNIEVKVLRDVTPK